MKSQTIRKYPGVLHRLDHVDLVGEPCVVLLQRMSQQAGRGKLTKARQSLRETLPHDALEVVVDREARRHIEVGQVGLGR